MNIPRQVLCYAILAALLDSAALADPSVYVWKSRVLLVFAPGAADPSLAAQRRLIAAANPGATERNLVLVISTGGQDDPALRRRYGAATTGFEALLIGKDGGVKLTSTQPIPAQTLFDTIDAMPMRRDEATRKQS